MTPTAEFDYWRAVDEVPRLGASDAPLARLAELGVVLEDTEDPALEPHTLVGVFLDHDTCLRLYAIPPGLSDPMHHALEAVRGRAFMADDSTAAVLRIEATIGLGRSAAALAERLDDDERQLDLHGVEGPTDRIELAALWGTWRKHLVLEVTSDGQTGHGTAGINLTRFIFVRLAD